ncbi:RNA recognition domain-containing protein [Sclerotinia borealis F-4128]|uniref:RNA recognition domain-containing protein n=1 Tax=Sclerotinia borealis (strain F-4128) TaxID=1432307 RepID=W9CAA2_SCLBF|nr:RNA recognition domain-containing protein [Sclerotinia borealis F-4128]
MSDSSNWRGGPLCSRRSSSQATDRVACRKKPPEDVQVHRPEQQQEDSPETIKAIAEGRRVYLGNLLYTTTPDDINKFLAKNSIVSATNVHVSIDPFTGRCPGYCFIEFAEKGNAGDAMRILEGLPLFGRPVKCRPCRPKGNLRHGGPGYGVRDENSSLSYNRWGDWEGSGVGDPKQDRLSGQTGPDDAMRYFQVSKAQEEGRQLRVDGLPRMLDQSENDLEIRSIFKDFEIDAVSKRVSPRDNNPDNHRRNFCYIDFTTSQGAQAARQAIDGILYRDAPLKFAIAIPKSSRKPDKYATAKEKAMGSSRWT